MKRISRRLQRLSAGAERIQDIVNQVPGRVESVRRSVFEAADKLQQVRADLTASAGALRGRAETDAAGLLHEVGEVAEILHGSGFELDGVDWDISSSRRLQVRLDRVEPTTVEALRALLVRHDGKPVARAILTGLIQAQEAAEHVEVGRLVWTDVVIDVGMIPAVRIGWRELVEDDDEAVTEPSSHRTSPPALPVASAATSSGSPHQTGSFFAPRSVEVRPASPEPVVPQVPVPTAAPVTVSPVVKRPPAASDPMSLERFKRMPRVDRR